MDKQQCQTCAFWHRYAPGEAGVCNGFGSPSFGMNVGRTYSCLRWQQRTRPLPELPGQPQPSAPAVPIYKNAFQQAWDAATPDEDSAPAAPCPACEQNEGQCLGHYLQENAIPKCGDCGMCHEGPCEGTGGGDQQTAQTAREWVQNRLFYENQVQPQEALGDFLSESDANELADMHDAQRARADRAEARVRELTAQNGVEYIKTVNAERKNKRLLAERDQLRATVEALRNEAVAWSCTIEARTAERDGMREVLGAHSPNQKYESAWNSIVDADSV